jgi:integrase
VVKLRPATQAAYKSALAHVLRHFGRARLSDVTPTDVARFVSVQEAAGLKGSTVRGQCAALSSVFTYASRHLGYVGVNPVSLLDRVERPSTDDGTPKRILTGDELARLLAAVKEPHRLVFELAAETGARLGEVLGLVWDEIDFEAQAVRFTHQLDRRGKRQPLKTKRSRRVLEVTPGLIAKLRAAKLASAQSRGHELVFTSRAGTWHDHRNIGGRVLAGAVKRAGLEAIEDAAGDVVVPAPTFHALRHTHASALIAQGWDIEEVSRRLGHSSVATTQRIYVHEFDAASRSGERRARLQALYGAAGVEAPVEAADRMRISADGGESLPDPAPLRAIGDR